MDNQIKCYSLIISLLGAVVFSTGESSPTKSRPSSRGPLSCGLFDTLGYTEPQGDIWVELGQNLTITCHLSPDKLDKYNSSQIGFVLKEQWIDMSYVTPINSSSARLQYPMKETSLLGDYYYCQLRENESTLGKGICLNFVTVGVKPTKPVEDFNCISRNGDVLVCTWRLSNETNGPRNNFTLFYADANQTGYNVYCGQNLKFQNNCSWPTYRRPIETFLFNMTLSSRFFGNVSERYLFHRDAIIIPNQPEDLTIVNSTMDSLTIKWRMPNMVVNLNKGIVYKVKYQNQFDEAWKELVNNASASKSEIMLTLNNLYPHTFYDIHVSLRSAAAEDKPMYWSEPAKLTKRTSETIPRKPPETTMGSFETVPATDKSRTVYIYWQHIGKEMENGLGFNYTILAVYENEREISLAPSKVTKTYAEFKNVSNTNNYTFHIVSSNNVGNSNGYSTIFVPSALISPSKPISVAKMVREQKKQYQITWKTHESHKNIDNFTVFWCNQVQDRPNRCEGLLEWKTVPSSVFSFNKSLPVTNEAYQFAVSANYKSLSSGMEWTSCTAIEGQGGTRIVSLTCQNVRATNVDLRWALGCSGKVGRITGYKITYCSVKFATSPCDGEVQSFIVNNKNETLTLTDLKPYTTYMINVQALSNDWEGPQSEPIWTTTMEAAPYDPPSNFNVTQVTQTSISLSWKPPHPPNGLMKQYELDVSGQSYKIKANNCSECNITIDSLDSGEIFNISIRACTVACSPFSRPLTVETKATKPSAVPVPSIRDIKDRSDNPGIFVAWSRPSKPGGRNLTFQLCFHVHGDTEVANERFCSYTKEQSFSMSTKFCQKNPDKIFYDLEIQAITNSEYFGDWTKITGVKCIQKQALSPYIQVTVYVVGVLSMFVIVITVVLAFIWIWKKYKYMNDVEPKIPKSMTANGPKKESDIQLSNHTGSHLNENGISYKPDQELLLSDKEKDLIERNVDDNDEINQDQERESSGCGSGHGSGGSSSINCGTQISSDSGTEVDQIESSPDEYSSTSSRRSNMRQRLGSNDGYTRAMPVLTGVPAVGKTGYISNVVLNRPGGYVAHPPHWNTNPINSNTSSIVSKGYVSTPSTQPSSQLSSNLDSYCLLGWTSTESANHDKPYSNGPVTRDYITDSSSI